MKVDKFPSLQLYDYIVVKATILCDICALQDFIEGESIDTIDLFYNKGWRVTDGVVKCPKCNKQ